MYASKYVSEVGVLCVLCELCVLCVLCVGVYSMPACLPAFGCGAFVSLSLSIVCVSFGNCGTYVSTSMNASEFVISMTVPFRCQSLLLRGVFLFYFHSSVFDR